MRRAEASKFPFTCPPVSANFFGARPGDGDGATAGRQGSWRTQGHERPAVLRRDWRLYRGAIVSIGRSRELERESEPHPPIACSPTLCLPLHTPWASFA